MLLLIFGYFGLVRLGSRVAGPEFWIFLEIFGYFCWLRVEVGKSSFERVVSGVGELTEQLGHCL